MLLCWSLSRVKEMMNYGLAFVIGYVFFIVCRVFHEKGVVPWSPGGCFWGALAMGLNWVASL